jgi:hypothetical protein
MPNTSPTDPSRTAPVSTAGAPSQPAVAEDAPPPDGISADPPSAPLADAVHRPRRRGDAFDPDDMARRGRIGALVLHATHDARETTQKARESFLSRFEREVDPDGVLPEAERQRRAEYARRAYFARLARESALARRTAGPGHRHHRGSGRRAA